MEKNPAISVVVTTYNHEEYIAKAIESILKQTFQDFEIIVVDDGSPDNTKEVVLAIPDKRIKYVYQENSGLPACARNKGMSLSKGQYIAFLDGDDFWHEDKLQKCKKILDEMENIGLVCHNETIIHNDRILRYTSYGPYVEDMYSRLLLKGNCLHSSAVTIRREIFFDDRFKFSEDKNLFTIEDYEYWLRLSKKYRFYFLTEVLGYYRVTDSGAFLRNTESNTSNLLRLLDFHFDRIEHKSKALQRMIKRRRSQVISAAARMFHHKSDFRESRKWYLKAIAEYPLNYKAYIGFIGSLFNLRIVYR